MPRPNREWEDGGFYHVFSRGSNQRAIFYRDEDFTDLLHCLERVVQRHDVECLAYVLMPNHCHLLLHLLRGDLSPAIRELNGRYSLRFNRRHGHEAHLFKNRFGAVLQESTEQLIWTARYIVMNPVEAGMCRSPDEWVWSSYRATAGLEPCPPFLSAGTLHSFLSDVPERAVEMYVQLMAEPDTAERVPLGV